MLPSMVPETAITILQNLDLLVGGGTGWGGDWCSGFLKITLAQLFLICPHYRVAAMIFCIGAVKTLILDWLAV